MSTYSAATFTCPTCSHVGEISVLRGAHAQRAPEFRERALAGTLDDVTCTQCGRHGHAGIEMVYTDVPRGEWIYVARHAELPQWPDIEKRAKQLLHNALASSPAAAALPHDHVRVVFGTDELRERLVIWSAALDDAVVECLKLSCLREQPDVRRPGERIRVTSIDERAIAFTAGARPNAPRCGWEVPRQRVDEIAADPRWRTELPELFDATFVSIDRYLV